MSLDGLRAWIGEVERKLGKRTRVFLVLALIAIGGAGAAIYLAIDANDNSVSENDVQALQQEFEARIDGGGGGAELAQVEAEVSALKAEVEKLQGGGGSSEQNGGGSGGSGSGSSSGGGSGSSGSGSSGASGGASTHGGSENSSGSGASTPAVPNASGGSDSGNNSGARLGELFEKTREEAEKAENK